MSKSTGRPKTEDGFLLPTIKAWNLIFTDIERKLPGTSLVRGSIEDLVLDNPSGNCGHCDNELIRVKLGQNSVLNAGIIYCSSHRLVGGEGHPAEHWVEVWPYAGMFLGRDALNLKSPEQKIKMEFELSNPVVRSCYHNFDFLTQISEELQGRIGMVNGRYERLPGPAFRHPEL